MILCQDSGRFWVGEFSFEHDGCSEGAATGALDSNKRAFYRGDSARHLHGLLPTTSSQLLT